MARKTSIKVSIITGLVSACLGESHRVDQVKRHLLTYIGAAAGLLLVSCLTTPTRQGAAITRVQGTNENGVYTLDLGILGGCTNFLQA